MNATWLNLSTIATPRRIARLKRDIRGYPIPHTVAYRPDGSPDFRAIDQEKWLQAARLRRCGICGDVLGARIAFVGGPRSIANRIFTDLPMHRDCATYALRVCPFLAAPSFAYRRSIPEGMDVNTHVSTVRPDRFGLAICKDFRLARLTSNDVVIVASKFERVEWWAQGHITDGQT